MPRLFLVWQLGNRKRWAWLLGFCLDVLWIAYALDTEQYGFLVTASAFAVISARNWWRWGKAAPVPVSEAEPPNISR